MKKIASLNLDVTDYVLNGDIEKLSQLVEKLSEEVQTAYVNSFEEQQSLPENKVALVI